MCHTNHTGIADTGVLCLSINHNININIIPSIQALSTPSTGSPTLSLLSRGKMVHISQRALANLVPNTLHEIRSHCFHNQYDKDLNPDGIVALAVAENKLMRDEIVQHINSHMNITPFHLTYGEGPAGSSALRRAVASFVTDVFHPSMEITEKHICICNGAGSAVDNLSFCVGEPGEGILVGRPLYVGFFPDIEARAKCVCYLPFLLLQLGLAMRSCLYIHRTLFLLCFYIHRALLDIFTRPHSPPHLTHKVMYIQPQAIADTSLTNIPPQRRGVKQNQTRARRIWSCKSNLRRGRGSIRRRLPPLQRSRRPDPRHSPR